MFPRIASPVSDPLRKKWTRPFFAQVSRFAWISRMRKPLWNVGSKSLRVNCVTLCRYLGKRECVPWCALVQACTEGQQQTMSADRRERNALKMKKVAALNQSSPSLSVSPYANTGSPRRSVFFFRFVSFLFSFLFHFPLAERRIYVSTYVYPLTS